MAYEPKVWEGGEVITANALNDIEGGVASVNADFVPKTWACDDTITADELNRIEQGIANASGGEGIKNKTLTMTFVNNTSRDFEQDEMPATYIVNENGLIKQINVNLPQANATKVVVATVVPVSGVESVGVMLPDLPNLTQGIYSYIASDALNCELDNPMFGNGVTILDANLDASITLTVTFTADGGGGDINNIGETYDI